MTISEAVPITKENNTMSIQATSEKMNIMKLHGMLRAYTVTQKPGLRESMDSDELIAHLIDAEWDERYNKRLLRLLKSAGLRYQASIEQLDFTTPRNADKQRLLRFALCDWIRKAENMIITGPTGVGKSFIACALGHQACVEGMHVGYYNCMKLFTQFRLAKADGIIIKMFKKIKNHDLLILDDFALQPLDAHIRILLLEVLEDRYGTTSTLITSQLPPQQWYEIIGEPTIADAILDRMIHSSHMLELKGESMRKNKML
jgi:DNA replication protein DnaC